MEASVHTPHGGDARHDEAALPLPDLEPIAPGDLLRAALSVALDATTEPWVLAVSGGSDSMALLHAMVRWAPERLAAVATFDHATGDWATEAASVVAAQARRLGVTVVRERARVPGATEAAWRDARWSCREPGAKRTNHAAIAVAAGNDDRQCAEVG